MQRLKRVFNWAAFGSIRRRPHRDLRAGAGEVKIIVEASNRCIEDASVAPRLSLREFSPTHLKNKAPSAENAMLPENSAPPQARLLD
jgi:hypothetical protein